MRARVAAFAAVLVALLGLALPALAAAAAPEGPDPAALKSYQKNFGLPRGTAEANLEIQERASSIVGQLQAALGEDYAGVWFDNARGEFVIPVLSPDDRALATPLLQQTGLAGHFRFSAAESSWGELIRAHESLDRSLRGQIEAGHARTSIDPAANAVVVERASGLDQDAKSLIQSKADALTVDVEVEGEQGGRRSTHGSLTACHYEPGAKGCDLPVRGGLTLGVKNTVGGECTTGFPAVGNLLGHKFMLTAGHCLQGSASTQWVAFDSNGEISPHLVGSTGAWAFNGVGSYNDYGVIEAENNWWTTGPWKYQIVNWGVNQEYAIESEAWSYVGELVCAVTEFNGKICAPVTQVDTTYSDPSTIIEHTNVFGPACVHGGDSGAPVFNSGGHAALGVLSADNSWGGVPAECERYAYYTEITRDADLLGIKVAPVREGGAPSATTGGASNLQYFQATVSGAVNPNQVQTRYQFEYGLSTGYGSVAPAALAEAGHGSGSVAVSETLTGLQPGTVYHYRLRATSAAGTSYGADGSFKTPIPPPVAKTGPAKEGTETGATLTGSVEQPYAETSTTYWFKYGHTTAYGSESSHQAIVASSTAKPVSTVLSGLETGTTYHFRLVASNEFGTSEGPDEAFTVGWDVKSPPNEGAPFRMESASCGSPTMCMVVGFEKTTMQAKVWDRTKWTSSPVVSPPGAVETFLRDVSCPSAGFCMAVGEYKNTSGEIKTLAEKFNGTSWEVLSPPNRGGSTASNFFNGVSCFSATSCEVVGDYFPAVGTSKANGEYWNGTQWSSEVQLVAEETGSGPAYLRDVSCFAAKECLGVGFFEAANSEWKQLVGQWSGTTWSVTVNPEAPAGSTGAYLQDVSCSKAYYCAQAGFYDDGTGIRRPLIKSSAGGGFGIQSLAIPAGATTTELFGVSCPTPTSCMAIGHYRVPGRSTRGIAYAYEGSGWIDHYPLNPVDQVEGDGSLILQSVSCPRAGLCLGAGSYQSLTGPAPLAVSFQKNVPPTVSTEGATAITDAGATLRGKINPNGQKTTYFFEYGKTTSYGTSTAAVEAGEAETAAEFSQAVSGLESGTLYHFRIVASNGSGTVVGADATFTTPRKWRLQTSPNPSETKPVKFLTASCPTTAVCFAGGEYEPAAGTPMAFVERWSGGSWATQTFPSTVASIEGLSCTTATECIAAGYFLNGTTKVKTAATARWNGTSWALQGTPPVPTGAKESVLRDVSCQINGLCTAVGYYVSSSGQHLPLADRWNGSSWALQSPLVPSGTTLSELTGVSCRNWSLAGIVSTECNAVGFAEKSGVQEPLAERWPNNSWEIKTIGMPTGAKGAQMTSVSCPPPSGFTLQCMATGSYVPSTGGNSAYIARWNSPSWTISSTLSGTGVELNGVSCVSDTNCTAAGTFLKAGVPNPLAQQWNGTGWLGQLPPPPATAKASDFYGVSCDTAGNCTAVGYYEDTGAVKHSLADRYS